jgi:hypothetical protein
MKAAEVFPSPACKQPPHALAPGRGLTRADHVVDGEEGGGGDAAPGERLKDDGGVQPAQPRTPHVLTHVQAAETCSSVGKAGKGAVEDGCGVGWRRARVDRAQAAAGAGSEGLPAVKQRSPSSAARFMVSTGKWCFSSHSALRSKAGKQA